VNGGHLVVSNANIGESIFGPQIQQTSSSLTLLRVDIKNVQKANLKSSIRNLNFLISIRGKNTVENYTILTVRGAKIAIKICQ